MALVSGPLFSFDAAGKVGNSLVFSKWKGRNYVRRLVVPSNPKSGPQVGRRAMLRFLAQNWKDLATPEQATWEALAAELNVSPFNAYIRQNMANWHNFLAPSTEFTTDRSGTPSDNVLTGAVVEENRWKLTVTGSALGDGWGLVIFASNTPDFTPAVSSAVLSEIEMLITAHDYFWTPPEMGAWYFNSIAFSTDGAKAAAGGQQPASP